VAIWKTPSLRKIISLKGHTQRVLYQALSPCGKYIVTGAGDETLRFWDLGYNQDTVPWKNNTKLSGLFSYGGKKNKKKNKGSKLEIPVLR
jgi:WD40 repeat protein